MKKIFWLLIFIAIIVSIGIASFFLQSKNHQPASEIILFYGVGCTHCAKVEEFIKENKIEEKISFQKKEVYFNKKNANELAGKAKKCGLPTNEIGVPLLWDGSKCIVGDEDIINFFKEKPWLKLINRRVVQKKVCPN